MNLYKRNYEEILTDEEKNAVEEEKMFRKKKIGLTSASPLCSHPNEKIRKFLNHHFSLFPNNYLYKRDLYRLNLEQESEMFLERLNSAKNENEVQNYIKNNEKWFIPASLFKDYNFGHHDAYIFPEIALGEKYRADYMLLGKNSDGYSVVLIEFEDANVDYILKTSNSESLNVRKGLTQIKDWKRWMDDNRDYFLRSINISSYGIKIPTSRIYYCLVVSRRDKMTLEATELRSQEIYNNPNLKIVSYDRLVDNIKDLGMGF
ncbi:MAG: DUF4263 domain-containing protein [Clostridia bacterium]|nr:DUF4263 domain-containing protein [Clostridia bacterium]